MAENPDNEARVFSPKTRCQTLARRPGGVSRGKALDNAQNQVEEVVELGAGRVLAGLVKRIDRELMAISVGTPAELEALVKRL